MLTEELEYFGPGSFQYQLDEAYKNFVAFCRSRRLDHSQPPFKASKVPGNQNGIWAYCLPVSGVLLSIRYLLNSNLCSHIWTSLAKVKYPNEILLNAKAWNGRIVLAWLAEILPLAAQGLNPLDHDGRVTLTCHALILVQPHSCHFFLQHLKSIELDCPVQLHFWWFNDPIKKCRPSFYQHYMAHTEEVHGSLLLADRNQPKRIEA